MSSQTSGRAFIKSLRLPAIVFVGTLVPCSLPPASLAFGEHTGGIKAAALFESFAFAASALAGFMVWSASPRPTSRPHRSRAVRWAGSAKFPHVRPKQ